MPLQNSDAMRIGYFSAGGAVGNIKSVDSSAFLRVDAREDDVHAFATEAGEQIVKQTESIWCFNLYERIRRMRLVIDCDCCGKFHFLRLMMTDLMPGFLH